MTSEYFLQFTLRWEEWVRQNVELPPKQPLILLIDSGGGSLCHLSPEFTVACAARSIRPIYFAPYTASAVCPADQDPNSQCEIHWDKLRKTAESMTQLHALDMAHEAWEHAYQAKYIISGWKKCGFAALEPIDRSKVFGDRGKELFRTILPADQLVPTTKEGQAILQRPQGYRRAAARQKCAACGSRTPTSLPKCGYCGADNCHYDKIADHVQQGLKHGGYSKTVPPVANVEEALAEVEPGAKAHLCKWSGDLMAEMRKRKNSSTEQIEGAWDRISHPPVQFLL